jgi:hypothetical protein
MKKHCKRCNKATNHRTLERLGFMSQCVVAIVTGFKSDLREFKFECVECGTESK